MSEVVIKTTDLTKRFGDFTAADSLTMEVYAGEIFGFLGANGAGKTTAMRMLCGLSIPTSGYKGLYRSPQPLSRTHSGQDYSEFGSVLCFLSKTLQHRTAVRAWVGLSCHW